MDKQLAKQIVNGLKKSIQKWEDIVNEVGSDKASDNCSLCQKFNWTPSKSLRFKACILCPIYKVTGKISCEKSPYADFQEYLLADDRYSFFNYGDKAGMVFDEHSKELAQAELDFLKSLWQTPYVLEAKQILSGETQ